MNRAANLISGLMLAAVTGLLSHCNGTGLFISREYRSFPIFADISVEFADT